MNPQPEEELLRRLQRLESEINSSDPIPGTRETKTRIPQTAGNKSNFYVEKIRIWLNSLSGMKKLAATGVILLLSFWILQSVFKLVASIISLALLAALVYLGYKFFVSSSFQNKQ